MAEFIFEISAFSIKALVLGLVVFGGLVAIISASIKQKKSERDLEVQDLSKNDKKRQFLLKSKILPSAQFKKLIKLEKKKRKLEQKSKGKPRLFVLHFNGDMKASQVDDLGDQISALLSVAKSQEDRVLVHIESPGGMVHGYGLAAAQLMRIRDKGLHLTAAVDKVAASGGYLMASVAHEIVAAPFAILGSIGVLAQIPNLNRLLKKNNVDYEEVTSGKYKRSVSFLGEITPEGREHFEKKIQGTHVLFKEFVKELRPKLDLEEVATGDHWYGTEALELGLVDRLMTSDEYLESHYDTYQVLKISTPEKKSFIHKISQAAELGFERVIEKLLSRIYL